MPQCASGDECITPDEESASQNCKECQKSVHLMCADITEGAESTVQSVCCKVCSSQKEAPVYHGDEYRSPHFSIDKERVSSPYGPIFNRRSIYWRFFHVFLKDHPANVPTNLNSEAACCNICGKTVKSTGGTTSCLRQHLRGHHPAVFENLIRTQAAHEEKAAASVWNHNSEAAEEAAAAAATDYRNRKHPSIQPPERLDNPFENDTLRKKALFWQFYHLFNAENEDNIQKNVAGHVCCNVCGKTIHFVRGSTTPLQNHLLTHHKSQWAQLGFGEKYVYPSGCRPIKAAPATSTPRRVKGDKRKYLETIHRSIALWAIQRGLPLDVVEDKGFRKVLANVRTAAKHVTETDLLSRLSMQTLSVQQQVRTLAKNLRFQVREQIQDKAVAVIGATNHWVARASAGDKSGSEQYYASLSAHFFDKTTFTVQNVTLEVIQYTEISNDLVAEIAKRWAKWDDSLQVKMPYLVTGREPKDSNLSDLVGRLHSKKTMFAIDYDLQEFANIAFQGKYSCYAKEGEAPTAIGRAQQLSHLVGESRQLTKQLNEAQSANQSKRSAALSVVEDLEVCWHSTYAMAARLIKLRFEIGSLVSDHSIPLENSLSRKDWLILEDVVTMLKPFAQALKAIMGAKHVSMSMVPHALRKLRADLVALSTPPENSISVNEDVANYATQMLLAFNERYGSLAQPNLAQEDSSSGAAGLHKAYYFALALDPRFKSLAGLDLTDDYVEKLWRLLEEEMVENEIAFRGATVPKKQAPAGVAVKPKKRKRSRSEDEDEDNYFLQHFEQLQNDDESGGESAENLTESVDETTLQHDSTTAGAEGGALESIREECTREMAVYRQEKGLKIVDRESGAYNNPLGGWWKDRHGACPILWRLAQTYLPMPALSATMAIRFCSVGDVVPDANLDGSAESQLLAEDVIMLKQNSEQMEDLNLMNL